MPVRRAGLSRWTTARNRCSPQAGDVLLQERHKDTPQFGLIAEQVVEVNSDPVVRNENGEIYTVRYEAVNAMLLNEFLKEHGGNSTRNKKLRPSLGSKSKLKRSLQGSRKSAHNSN